MEIELKYEDNVRFELRCTENMLERAKSANNLRDQISRAYYACYHAAIAAIFLKEEYIYDRSSDNAHWRVRDQYAKIYSKTRGNRIVSESNAFQAMKNWHDLRKSADYDIFTDDFEINFEDSTKAELYRMYRFVNRHTEYVKTQLGEKNKN